jgi:adenylylsulfate kinase
VKLTKKKLQIKKNKGIVFWVTGLSGVGKTTISNHLHKRISKHFGKTLFFNGDDFRRIFNLKKHNLKSRKEYILQYANFCKFVTDQNINILVAVVGLFDFIHVRNRKLFDNYFEIFIRANSRNIKKNDKRKIYFKKDVFGKDLKPELPKKPHIISNNDFKKKPKVISESIFRSILKKI